MSEPLCPKCEGRMQQGFIMDQTYGSRELASWWKGRPLKSLLGGIKKPRSHGSPIGAIRCIRCGFLELYATAEFIPK